MYFVAEFSTNGYLLKKWKIRFLWCTL